METPKVKNIFTEGVTTNSDNKGNISISADEKEVPLDKTVNVKNDTSNVEINVSNDDGDEDVDIQVTSNVDSAAEIDKKIKYYDKKIETDIEIAKKAGVPDDICDVLRESVEYLSLNKIGALITFEVPGIDKYCQNGKWLNTPISKDIFIDIFYPGTKLHDGAVLIKDGKITYASVFFDCVDTNKQNSKYGARHRTAIGLSSKIGATSIVVSEETGRISFAADGKLIVTELSKFKENFTKYVTNNKTIVKEDIDYPYMEKITRYGDFKLDYHPMYFNRKWKMSDLYEDSFNMRDNFKLRKVYLIGCDERNNEGLLTESIFDYGCELDPENEYIFQANGKRFIANPEDVIDYFVNGTGALKSYFDTKTPTEQIETKIEPVKQNNDFIDKLVYKIKSNLTKEDNDEYRVSFDQIPENCPFLDVINQMKDVKYGFISKIDGSRIDDREWIHNCPNLQIYYRTNTNPLITLKNKLGICMDQSLLIQYLLKELHPKYSCQLYALRKGRFGHCVPTFNTEDGKYYYLENAWDKEQGLHGPFDNKRELEAYLGNVYERRHCKDTMDPVTVDAFRDDMICESLNEYNGRQYQILDEDMRITKEQREYSDYLIKHISNVKRGYFWIKENCPEMLAKCDKKHVIDNITVHDESKYSNEEYIPYSKYFYGSKRTPKIVDDFKIAVQHHYLHNPHHPEYWHGLPMPEDYVIEMICDWWSFSWKENNLADIFDFWNTEAKNSKSKSINEQTKRRVQELLDMLYGALKKKNMI